MDKKLKTWQMIFEVVAGVFTVFAAGTGVVGKCEKLNELRIQKDNIEAPISETKEA